MREFLTSQNASQPCCKNCTERDGKQDLHLVSARRLQRYRAVRHDARRSGDVCSSGPVCPDLHIFTEMLREKGGGEEKERRVCARARVRVWTVRGAGGQGRWGVQVERREREFVGQQERRIRWAARKKNEGARVGLGDGVVSRGLEREKEQLSERDLGTGRGDAPRRPRPGCRRRP